MSSNNSRAPEPECQKKHVRDADLCVHFPNFFHLYSFWDTRRAMKVETILWSLYNCMCMMSRNSFFTHKNIFLYFLVFKHKPELYILEENVCLCGRPLMQRPINFKDYILSPPPCTQSVSTPNKHIRIIFLPRYY